MTHGPNSLSADPTSAAQYRRPDDRFVPLRASELAEALAADSDTFGQCAAALRGVAHAIEDVIEQETTAMERSVCERYAAFNPDRDTEPLELLDRKRTPQDYDAMSRRLAYLLDKANFERMTDVQIAAAIASAQSHGLRIRLHAERVDDLSLWVRGRGAIERRRRSWRHPFRAQATSVEVFRRVAVVAHLRDDPHIMLKLFKEIPVADLEALLPHAEVMMSWFDRLMLMGGSAGAVGSTAGKALSLIKAAALLSKLVWVLLFGCIVLLVRTVMGYRSARTKRDSRRTQHLYFQNLGNNAGVIHSLASMIAQEEIKEALLAYAVCLSAGRKDSGIARVSSPGELGDRVGDYLHRRFNIKLEYDAADALESLDRLSLWEDRAAFRVVPPEQAVDRLGSHWRERLSLHYHETQARGDPAEPRLSSTP